MTVTVLARDDQLRDALRRATPAGATPSWLREYPTRADGDLVLVRPRRDSGPSVTMRTTKRGVPALLIELETVPEREPLALWVAADARFPALRELLAVIGVPATGSVTAERIDVALADRRFRCELRAGPTGRLTARRLLAAT